MGIAGLCSQLRVKIWGISWGSFLLPWFPVRGRRVSHAFSGRVKFHSGPEELKEVRSTRPRHRAGYFFHISPNAQVQRHHPASGESRTRTALPKQATEFPRKVLGQPINKKSTNILAAQQNNSIPICIGVDRLISPTSRLLVYVGWWIGSPTFLNTCGCGRRAVQSRSPAVQLF